MSRDKYGGGERLLIIQLLRTMCIIQTLNEPKCDRYKITHAHTALLTLLFMILFACRIV